MTKANISFERVKFTNPRYWEYRKRHYVPINGKGGCYGRQLHYLVLLDGKQIGIISGASPAMQVKPRDDFFGIPHSGKDLAKWKEMLGQIIDNVIYRIELEKPIPNLASQILALWRRRVSADWIERYGGKVIGFETFVDGDDERTGVQRGGVCYKADNWKLVGSTRGSAKAHVSGMHSDIVRRKTSVKLIFCRRI